MHDPRLTVARPAKRAGRTWGRRTSSKHRTDLTGRKAVSEEPQDMTLTEGENPEPQDDSALTETSAAATEKAESEDSEADFEAHGSWGGIG